MENDGEQKNDGRKRVRLCLSQLELRKTGVFFIWICMKKYMVLTGWQLGRRGQEKVN